MRLYFHPFGPEVSLRNPVTSKDAAKKTKDLASEYRMIKCRNLERLLNIGYYEPKGGWNKIKRWCETHTPDCKFATAMETLRRPLVNRAVESGNIGYNDIKLIAKSVYREYGLLDKHLLADPKFEENINKWYESTCPASRSHPFAPLPRRDFQQQWNHILSTSNRVLLVGIVAAPSESSETVSFLMAPILGADLTHCVMTNKGLEYSHTLCMFHLSWQLPRKRAESVGEWRKLADMFAGTAKDS